MSIPGLSNTHVDFNDDELDFSTIQDPPVHMELMKMVVGVMAGPGIDFNNMEDKIFREFSSSAPPWRIVTKGLNLEAVCQTSSCVAYSKRVWVKQGFGTFDLVDMIFDRTTKCPICNKPTKDPENSGFYDCTFEINGRMIEPQRKAVQKIDTAPPGKLTTFKPNAARWINLTITTNKV